MDTLRSFGITISNKLIICAHQHINMTPRIVPRSSSRSAASSLCSSAHQHAHKIVVPNEITLLVGEGEGCDAVGVLLLATVEMIGAFTFGVVGLCAAACAPAGSGGLVGLAASAVANTEGVVAGAGITTDGVIAAVPVQETLLFTSSLSG